MAGLLVKFLPLINCLFQMHEGITLKRTLRTSLSLSSLEAFVKERNEALFSLDRKKIEAYMIKYGETEIAQTPDVVFWASVYKAICGVKDAPEAIVSKAKAWLHEHGMSPYLAG